MGSAEWEKECEVSGDEVGQSLEKVLEGGAGLGLPFYPLRTVSGEAQG